MHDYLNDWNGRMRRFVDGIIRDDIDAAEDYLAAHYARGGSPLRGLQLVLMLMTVARDRRQAIQVCYLADEFLSDALPLAALRLVRESERRMHLRLGLRPRLRLGS